MIGPDARLRELRRVLERYWNRLLAAAGATVAGAIAARAAGWTLAAWFLGFLGLGLVVSAFNVLSILAAVGEAERRR